MSSAIVHSYYFTEAGLLAFIEFHSLYNLLIEVLVQVPGVVVILCSMLTSVVIVAVLCEGLGLGLEFFKKVLTTTLEIEQRGQDERQGCLGHN